MKHFLHSCRTLVLSLLFAASFSLSMGALSFTAHAFDPFSLEPTPGENTACDQKDPEGNRSAICDSKNQNDPITGPNGLVMKGANLISILTGIAAIVVLMIASFRYITSTGDGQKTASAKNAILYSLIGLGVVIVARQVVALVINRL